MGDKVEWSEKHAEVAQALLDNDVKKTVILSAAYDVLFVWHECESKEDAEAFLRDVVRMSNENLLEGTGLLWMKRRNGAHWMLRGDIDVDVYPGTGRWRFSGLKGSGVARLLKLMGVSCG